MHIRAVPDELMSVKRLAARPTCVQRQQKGRSVERPLTLLAEEVGFGLRFQRRPTPPSQAQSGEFLKTCHWHVFYTEFHLISSNPTSP